jgi:hypothetical protein
MYLALRQMAFSQTRKSLNLPVVAAPFEPYGVILEMGMERGCATLFMFADGSASLYFSTGGGFIGGQGQPKVNEAAKTAVAQCARYVPVMAPVTAYPAPQEGQHLLYLLTDEGLRGGAGQDEEFAAGRHLLTPLWRACQEVITQYRLLQQRQRD